MCCNKDIDTLAAELVALLQKNDIAFATAESCTGGAISAAVTSVPGCSSVMRGGVVAYHNDIKSGVLGVRKETLETAGAVSEETVVQMATGVAALMNAGCAVATSGIAGPGGGSAEKPVGTVWTAVFLRGKVTSRLLRLQDKGRAENIRNTVKAVLEMAIDEMER